MITIPYTGGQRTGPTAIAEAEPLLRALMALGTEKGGKLQLDPLLKPACGQLGDQLTGRAAIE